MEERMKRCGLIDCKSVEEILPITVMRDSYPFITLSTLCFCKEHRNVYATSGWEGIEKVIRDLDPEWAKAQQEKGKI
mgnify:FL=1